MTSHIALKISTVDFHSDCRKSEETLKTDIIPFHILWKKRVIVAQAALKVSTVDFQRLLIESPDD